MPESRVPLLKEHRLSRIQQVIETLEAERAHVLKQLTWLEQQIKEFHAHNGDSAASPNGATCDSQGQRPWITSRHLFKPCKGVMAMAAFQGCNGLVHRLPGALPLEPWRGAWGRVISHSAGARNVVGV